jgi:hypothetical protein
MMVRSFAGWRRSPLRVLLALTVLGGCSGSAQVTATRSLRGATDVSVICAALDGTDNLVGRPLSSCPDLDETDNEDRSLFALVTQKETGEVAVISMGGCADGAGCRGSALDLEATVPGTNFLPVGGEPVAIASTPGGTASFVAVAEPGQEGIFALPTSCIGPRPADAPYRDLRTFPACRLPAAPSLLEVLKDPQGRTGLCDGSTPVRTPDTECPADLAAEGFGRSKLAVALPSLGQIAVLDAQTLLDLPQGGFAACPVESWVPLQVDLPDRPIPSALPPDLASTPAECLPQGFSHASEQSFTARPSDFALRDETLYVSDYDAPVIHVLDVSDPCNIAERPPLLPRSFMDPDAVVTTRRVAASPLTPSGKQFVYAVDNGPTSPGSVMIFDVTRESGQRTPLVRPRSNIITHEPPDRIQFDQEVSDVEFALHDYPAADPQTGVAVEGVACDPDPAHSGSPGALYRPDPETGEGAGPRTLRGAFAFMTLHSGFLVTVDVEDLDAPCRRPATVNSSNVADEFGCFGDPFSSDLTQHDIATVSNEFSCNISEPHRPRAGSYFFDEAGGSAPALRSFPQLRDKTGASLATDQSDSGKWHPRLLAVDRLPGGEGPAAVTVGTTRYENSSDQANRLVIDPALSDRNSLVLPYEEPRAYTNNLQVSVAYEGAVRPLSDGLIELRDKDELALPDAERARLPRSRYAVLSRGPNANFCDAGIEDDHLIRDRIETLSEDPGSVDEDKFGSQYADYVDVTSEVLPEDDRYWQTQAGKTCGKNVSDASNGVTGRPLCDLVFGTPRLPNTTRELRVQRAFNEQLILEPRRYQNETERENILDLVQCCFPGDVEFRVRASQQWVVHTGGVFDSDVGVDRDTLACIRDCNPIVAGKNSRVFELACDGPDDCAVDDKTSRAIGPAEFPDDGRSLGKAQVCVLDHHPAGGVSPGDPGSACFYDTYTGRFAIYRGLAPSERDMQFSWRIIGGFSPLSIDLLALNGGRTSTNPQKLRYVPSVNRLLIADGGSTAFMFVGLKALDGGPGFSGAAAF